MKKNFLLFMLLISAAVTRAQITVNANSVIAVSSEYIDGTFNYYATHTLGAKDVTGCVDDDLRSWLASTQDGQREFLVLGIPVISGVTEIKVYENLTPGTIDTIYVRSALDGTWAQVFQTTAGALSCPNVFTVSFSALGYPIDAVRIAMNSPAVADWNEIDAIDVTGLSLLSVNLVSFTGSNENGNAALKWTTQNESNNGRFEIEYSTDGKNFNTAGTVLGKNLAGINTYTYAAPMALNSPAVYYRLKIFDKNQRITYSNTIKLFTKETADVSVYPNPAANFITLSGIGKVTQIQLVSMDGKVILSRTNNTAAATLPVANVVNGTYFIRLISAEKTVNQKIIIAR
jgi:Secretion system C-terminal sorting domain